MESEINKPLPFIHVPIAKTPIGLWFISGSLSVSILLQLFYLPFTSNDFFNLGFYGWLIDISMPIVLISFATGLIFKANWARLGLLYFAWLSISGTLFSLLITIGFYDVSGLSIWHYLILTIIFIWNIWVILYLTQTDILTLFKSEQHDLI